VLPALPVLYVAGRRDDIARWGSAIGGALVLVTSLYSWLDWMIMVT
jgi:poly(3-hydroxyalkanoate) synthetase